jgi:hypothetical protein
VTFVVSDWSVTIEANRIVSDAVVLHVIDGEPLPVAGVAVESTLIELPKSDVAEKQQSEHVPSVVMTTS